MAIIMQALPVTLWMRYKVLFKKGFFVLSAQLSAYWPGGTIRFMHKIQLNARIPEEMSDLRLDQALARLFPDYSRARFSE